MFSVSNFGIECTFPVFFNGFNVFNFFWSSALKLAVNISNDVQNRPQWVKNSEKLYGLSNVNNNIKMLLFLDGIGPKSKSLPQILFPLHIYTLLEVY